MGRANGTEGETVWARLAEVPVARLVRYLEPQAPQTVAALLLRLPPDPAAAVLAGLSDGLRARVLRAMAATRPMQPDVLAAVEPVLRADLLDRPEPVEADPSAAVAGIVGRLPPEQREAAMEALRRPVPPLPPTGAAPRSGASPALAPPGPDLATLAPGLAAMLNARVVVGDRLPMLEVVMDRFVRLLASSLRGLFGQAEVGLESLRSLRFGDWLNDTGAPLLAVFRAEPWDNYGLLALHGDLLDGAGEVLFGGSPETAGLRVAGRRPTGIDRAFADRLAGAALEDLAVAFAPVGSVAFPLDRLEGNPRFAAISRPANASFVADLRVVLDGQAGAGRQGRLELLIPYATLEPVRDALARMFMGERFGRDPRWEAHLRSEVARATVRLHAVAGAVDLPLGALLAWRGGTVVDLGADAGEAVALVAGGATGRAVARGALGRQGSRWAVAMGMAGPLDPVTLPEAAPLPCSTDVGGPPLQDVAVRVSAVVGAAEASLASLPGLRDGGCVALDRAVGDPVDLVVEGRVVARGELVIRSGRRAVRLDEVAPSAARTPS